MIVHKTSEELLREIEELSSLIRFQYKRKDAEAKQNILSLLNALEQLIQLSADRFLSLDVEGYLPAEEEEQQRSEFIVHPDDLLRAKDYSASILLKLISTEISFPDNKQDEDENESRMERASRILAHMSGRGAAGSITRIWHIPYLNDNGEKEELLLPLHEPCYVGNDLGFKTWGAAPMMAKKLLQNNIIPHICDCTVLEIGTGTGMVGIVCDYLGAAEVHMTDYHPRVIENVSYNIHLNNSRAQVSKLDFIKLAKKGTADEEEKDDAQSEIVDNGRQYDIVIASDLLYELEHAEYLPPAINKLAKNEFYFMIPLRETHWEEVRHFESKMDSLNQFLLRKVEDLEKEDEEEGLIKFRYYEYVRIK
ncbi:putative methyltransferase-domain-containing protein [Mycotypha africana]|uniref:putative methyltransferase-domain-containing protein n=1 Tax=Mycotypha africana TaxID=64632 RepID=UPI002301B2AF|nr:putative methyltransferase-domain-containing protein [Mycotypha africana]KAI8977465.1 putative methyltransferase-domain-containing protein [Mycotypha africana]